LPTSPSSSLRRLSTDTIALRMLRSLSCWVSTSFKTSPSQTIGRLSKRGSGCDKTTRTHLMTPSPENHMRTSGAETTKSACCNPTRWTKSSRPSSSCRTKHRLSLKHLCRQLSRTMPRKGADNAKKKRKRKSKLWRAGLSSAELEAQRRRNKSSS
jgi:hypothetical protein